MLIKTRQNQATRLFVTSVSKGKIQNYSNPLKFLEYDIVCVCLRTGKLHYTFLLKSHDIHTLPFQITNSPVEFPLTNKPTVITFCPGLQFF